jgi:hypothetical protein
VRITVPKTTSPQNGCMWINQGKAFTHIGGKDFEITPNQLTDLFKYLQDGEHDNMTIKELREKVMK